MQAGGTKEKTVAELLHGVEAGDRDAFAALFEREAERLLAVARAAFGEGGRAEDAVEQAFLRLWQHAADGTAAAPGDWLVALLRETAEAPGGKAAPVPAALRLRVMRAVEDRAPASGAAPAPPISKARAARLERQAARRMKGVHPAMVALGLGIAAFMGFAVNDVVSRPLSPIVVAILVDELAVPGAVVEAFADNSVRIVPLAEFPVPEHLVIELWTRPDPEGAPMSLGTFRTLTELRLSGPELWRPVEDHIYQMTLEPQGGSPEAGPTGPTLVAGIAQSVR